MPLGLLTSGDSPKGGNERAPVFVYGDGVKAVFNVIAELGVVEPQCLERIVSCQRSKADTGGYAIRTHRIPYAYAFYRARVVECSLLCQAVISLDRFPIAGTRRLRLRAG